MSDAQRQVTVVRVRGGSRAANEDRAAVEEPLEIRLHDRPFAVIMRTPGADRELAAGFLLAERVIRSAADLGPAAHCPDRGADGPAEAGRHVRIENVLLENIVNVTLANGTAEAIERLLADRR